MGRSRVVPFTVSVVADSGAWTPAEWYGRRPAWMPADVWATTPYGKPTDERLAKWVAQQEAATRPGGVNAHLGETRILKAVVFDQKKKEVVARYGA